jgi:uncharacterized 2Fe-2S/4Fe-4S cluster protein (DUF4445 family)
MDEHVRDLKSITVEFEPIGRRIEVNTGVSLLSAAQEAGIQIHSICGGDGSCESCRIRLISGELSPLTRVEKDALLEETESGYRLACQAKVLDDVKIDIPPESLTTPQRLQLEGQVMKVEVAPQVRTQEVRLTPPTLQDLRSDADRVYKFLEEEGIVVKPISLPVLQQLPGKLRELDWQARLAMRGDEIVAVLSLEDQLLGLAVDIGTTKLAAYLVDLEHGQTLAKTGAMNPQISYGEDVVSRIAYVDQNDQGSKILQSRLVETLNEMIGELCDQAACAPEQIVDVVVVGNTVMHHLFAGLPVRQLGLAPYVPAISSHINIPSTEIGLTTAPGANVFMPPIIAGYVGADHVAMLLATRLWQTQKTTIALDIGTNTEITLASGGRLLCCSCASGPAFEGAHIHDGMRAAPGAIERVQIEGTEIRLSTINHEPPIGICGSGILDVVAEALDAGLIEPTGRMKEDHPLVRNQGRDVEIVLVDNARRKNGRDIVVTRADVNEIQLAKGAIRAGIDTLLEEADLTYGDIEEIILAGAFGTYLNPASTVKVGMFPPVALEKIRQVGNAAGVGSVQMLISMKERQAALEIFEKIEYVELTTHPKFSETFLKALRF